ncbi:hypothetical protein QYM36_008001 [Artemia franciscana]|uniref:Uncharacterized protein n=2 Tax=Artemia franciscana TaxID=6661 RepID=A0AA88IFG6_ARTSF|nr:hypothetical protein QYM36_008001 [Artemia franciscana]KAK2727353.1 hypothetical protein QYM36_008001 [Artemia franciscana]KAK2727354.1 hypothetical protein QYM36_008001 [Artemia franciscana]
MEGMGNNGVIDPGPSVDVTISKPENLVAELKRLVIFNLGLIHQQTDDITAKEKAILELQREKELFLQKIVKLEMKLAEALEQMRRQADEMSHAKDFYDFVGNSGHHGSDNGVPWLLPLKQVTDEEAENVAAFDEVFHDFASSHIISDIEIESHGTSGPQTASQIGSRSAPQLLEAAKVNASTNTLEVKTADASTDTADLEEVRLDKHLCQSGSLSSANRINFDSMCCRLLDEVTCSHQLSNHQVVLNSVSDTEIEKSLTQTDINSKKNDILNNVNLSEMTFYDSDQVGNKESDLIVDSEMDKLLGMEGLREQNDEITAERFTPSTPNSTVRWKRSLSNAARHNDRMKKLFIEENKISPPVPKDVPSPPGIPRASKVGEDFVSLSWDSPSEDGGAPIIGFWIEKCEIGSFVWERINTTVCITNQITISCLMEDREYDFRVLAENELGTSLPSTTLSPVRIFDPKVCPPEVVQPMVDFLALGYRNVSFTCQILGHPPPFITWHKGDRELWESDKYKIKSNDNVYSLEIEDVCIDDEGEYLCSAVNKRGQASSSARLFVRVPPKISLPPTFRETAYFNKGDSIVLAIPFSGIPEPIITWLRDSEQILSDVYYDVKIQDGSAILTIRDATPFDTASYRMVAENEHGVDSVTVKIRIRDRPDPPSSLKVEDVTHDSLILSWQPPSWDGGSAIMNYTVEKRDSLTSSWELVCSTAFPIANIEELSPSRNYHFRVYAENIHGSSDASEIVSTVTSKSLSETREVKKETKASILPEEVCYIDSEMIPEDSDLLLVEDSYHVACVPKQATMDCTLEFSVEVPTSKIRVFSPVHSIDGIEPLSEEVFLKRHAKYDTDEKKRKRWDNQRLREQLEYVRLRSRYESEEEDAVGSKAQPVKTFLPNLDHVEKINIYPSLPVNLFGTPLHRLEKREFNPPSFLELTKSDRKSRSKKRKSSC